MMFTWPPETVQICQLNPLSNVSWLWHNTCKDSDTSVQNDTFIPNGGKLREVLSHDKLSQLYDTIHYTLPEFSREGGWP